MTILLFLYKNVTIILYKGDKLMRLVLKYENKYDLALGYVYVENDRILCKEFPFIETVVKIKKETFKLNVIAFSLLDNLLLSIIEILNKTDKVYFLSKLTKEGIEEDRTEFMIGPNYKATFNAYVRELERYSVEEDIDYAKMFKSCSCKKGIEC